MSEDLSLVHMLETALISEFHHVTGCRNAANTGGEGVGTRMSRPDPPFFVYVTGGRVDQLKRVGPCWVEIDHSKGSKVLHTQIRFQNYTNKFYRYMPVGKASFELGKMWFCCP